MLLSRFFLTAVNLVPERRQRDSRGTRPLRMFDWHLL
jgi:hypothetical protein